MPHVEIAIRANRRNTTRRLRPADELTARWVHVRFAGQVIANSRHAWLLTQYGRDQLPSYYFPQSDVRMEYSLAGPSQTRTTRSAGGQCRLATRLRRTPRGLFFGRLRFSRRFAGMSHSPGARWTAGTRRKRRSSFTRDPHKRVDVLPSSRHVRVAIDGAVVAETRRPHLLFETTLPTRYYIPREDVRMELLEPTGLKTRCPYKGIASVLERQSWPARGSKHRLELSGSGC